MRNPIKTVAAKLETSAKAEVQERVRTHFQDNKRTYIACGITAVVVAGITTRTARPVVNVTVVNHLV